MIEDGMRLHITETELARDTHAVLAKVQEGVEVIVEQDHRPVAIIKTLPAPGGRSAKASLSRKRMKGASVMHRCLMPISQKMCKPLSTFTASH